MKISYDYDGVLTNETFTELARFITGSCRDRYLLTDRFCEPPTSYNKAHYEIWQAPHNLHFAPQNVLFLGGTGVTKLDVIKELGINIHFDDDPYTIDEINKSNCGCLGILVGYQHLEHIGE